MSTLKINTVEEARSIFDEIKRNDLMSQKYRKQCKYLNYVKTLDYSSFDSYLLRFHFSIWFISLCSCRFTSPSIGIKI